MKPVHFRTGLGLLLSATLSIVAFTIPDGSQVAFRTNSIQRHSVDVQHLLDDAKRVILRGKNNLERWFHDGKEYIKQNNLLYELISHPSFGEHKLRVTEPKLCDPSVKQYSGYLDIAEDKHLFFWFFESRSSPKTDPLILWLNGGPGCSSSTGLLFELGPCRVTDEGRNTTHNPHSWNNNANIIFLDQPVNVGYSYADDGTSVNNSPVAGKDVHAFLELFLNRYPKYADAPFHIAAESYGGVYGPNIASVVHKANKEKSYKLKKINLASVILANGLTDPYIQHGTLADYLCDGPYPVYSPDSVDCQSLRSKIPTCQRLVQSCYNYNSKLACVPAALYCNSMYGPFMQLGLNPYDVRKPCDRSKDKDGPLCYSQMGWLETWLNFPANKAALGVDPTRDFEACNMQVNQAFTLQGDGMHNTASLLPDIIDDGVRLLVYAGNADMMCNFIGNGRWVEQLKTKFLPEYTKAKSNPWVTEAGVVAGEVRSAGNAGFSAGNVSFVTVYEAGHMVPYDQPENALDMISRWVRNTPLSFVESQKEH